VVVFLFFLNQPQSASAQERFEVIICQTVGQIQNIKHHWWYYGRDMAEVIFAIYANQTLPSGMPYCFNSKTHQIRQYVLYVDYVIRPENQLGPLRAMRIYEVQSADGTWLQALATYEIFNQPADGKLSIANND